MKYLLFFFSLCTCALVNAQPARIRISGITADSIGQPIPAVTVMLLKASDSATVKMTSTDPKGIFAFEDVMAGHYVLVFSATGYNTYRHVLPVLHSSVETGRIALSTSPTLLAGVTVVNRRPLIELRPDRTIINVESSITNVGATALEVLEKSPGVTVDKNGTISLKGKQNVLVMMDGKQTYLSSSDLTGYLQGINAAQIDQIEIMTNPSAKYDASGNAGIINIKLKKNRTKGFNGSLSLSYGQGKYYKTFNNILLNYRNGSYNVYVNYAPNLFRYFTDLYAMRRYYAADDKTVTNTFEQTAVIRSPIEKHNFKTGIDYYLDKKTTLGFSFGGLISDGKTKGYSRGEWKSNEGTEDSVIVTTSDNKSVWTNLGATLSARHSFSDKKELSLDLDVLDYDIHNDQYYLNTLTGNSTSVDGLRGVLPSTLRIYSGKVDYTQTFGYQLRFETGWKSSLVRTDNTANYDYYDGSNWSADLTKTNRFLYEEMIHAAYVNAQQPLGKLTLQGGLRFEETSYDANQIGNSVQKDSSFSRKYGSLFPTAYVSYQADSAHSFTVSAGRRIDRPAFQKLNPFVFLINKYTYQKGNPYFRPQYTWNMEFTHQFKQLLTTTLSYSITSDYFSQIFLSDSVGLIIYTEGNVGRMTNAGVSLSMQLAPASWWSVTLQCNYNHKNINGVVVQRLSAKMDQASLNVNNQFRFKKGWSAEVSGYYIGRSQNDLQEVLDPTGQLNIGIGKLVLKNKGTVRLSIRDMLYTQRMAGLTSFQYAREYFILKRDTRVVTLAFNWRFGKLFKNTPKRSGGSADELKQRAGGG